MRRLGYVMLLAPLALVACGDSAGSGGSGGEGGDDNTTSTTKASTGSSMTTASSMNTTTGMSSTSTGMSNCGNDMVDAGEACDGADLDGETCVSQGFSGGTLGCTNTCSFDTSECANARCGNDTIEGMEVCDGTDLDGQSCITQGFDTGELDCNASCSGFDTTGCADFSCGDGSINGAEQCDGAMLGGATCATQGFDGGMLGCSNCMFNTTACVNESCVDNVDNDGDAMVDCADTGSCAAECADACLTVPTILDPSTTTGSTTDHADVFTNTCGAAEGGTSGPEVVYQVVASMTGFMHVTLTSTPDLGISAWTGCPNVGTQGACEDLAFGATTVETISFPVTTGQTVHLMVDGFGDTSEGAFTLQVGTVAAATCGDGFKDGAEVCDDGNTADDDGCNATCSAFECAFLSCPGDADSCTAECTPSQGCVATFTPVQPNDKCLAGAGSSPFIDTPGCTSGSQGVIAAVCDLDPYCCETDWDTQCVGEVYSFGDSKICSASQGTCAHTLCSTGAALAANCDSAFGDCVDLICAADSFCCTNSWDSQCVGEVASICGLNCN